MKKILLILSLALTVAACEKDDEKNSYTCSCDSATGLIDYPLGSFGELVNQSFNIYPQFTLDGKEDTAGLVRFKDASQSEDIFITDQPTRPFRGFLSSLSKNSVAAKIQVKLKGEISFDNQISGIAQTYVMAVYLRNKESTTEIIELDRQVLRDNPLVYSFNIDYTNDIDIAADSEWQIYFYMQSSGFSASNVKLTIEQPTEYKNIEVSYNGGRASYVVSCNE